MALSEVKCLINVFSFIVVIDGLQSFSWGMSGHAVWITSMEVANLTNYLFQQLTHPTSVLSSVWENGLAPVLCLCSKSNVYTNQNWASQRLVKPLGVFLLPLDEILVHLRLPPSILSGCPQSSLLVPIYIPWWREAL